jgi:L-amino acid N-acyltransferase YncA
MKEISIKSATHEHSKAIWEWRNDETTRAMSLNQDLVSWENHQSWYERVLINKDRHLYVGYTEGILLGMVRFDKHENQEQTYEVSINLDPQQRGKGLGKLLLAKAVERFWDEVADASLILAEIKKENEASKKAFENAGFQEQRAGDALYEFFLSRK